MLVIYPLLFLIILLNENMILPTQETVARDDKIELNSSSNIYTLNRIAMYFTAIRIKKMTMNILMHHVFT